MSLIDPKQLKSKHLAFRALKFVHEQIDSLMLLNCGFRSGRGRAPIVNGDASSEIERMQIAWKATERAVIRRLDALHAAGKRKPWRKETRGKH